MKTKAFRLSLVALLASLCTVSAQYFRTGGNVSFSWRVTIAANLPASPTSLTPQVLWWKLNEGSGTAVTGTASNGGDSGTMDGTWLTGKSGSGFATDFNGTPGDAKTSAAITFGSSKITVCFWAYPDTSDGATRTYMQSGSGVGAFHIYSDAGGLSIQVTGSTSGSRAETITKPAAGAWVHILAVLDNSTSTGDVIIYKDGVIQSESIIVNDKVGSGNFSSLVVSVASFNAGAGFFYDGRLDDVRIYSDDQSANVVAIMNDAQ